MNRNRLMTLQLRPYLMLFPLVFLTGCGESQVLNAFGMGKDQAPQESTVGVGHALSMPPDLNLPAPVGDGTQPYLSPPPTVPVTVTSGGGAYANAPGAVAARPGVTATNVSITAAPVQPASDIYGLYGISKTKPDGKPKTDGELFEELRKAKLAKKRAANPNYGTIGNFGNLFKNE